MYRQSDWWTEEKDAQLRALIDEGMDAIDVAAAMGRTRNSVIGRAWRINYNHWSRPKAAAPRNASRHKSRKMNKPKPRRSTMLLMPVKAPAPPPQPASDLNVQIWDLEQHHCRWIVAGWGAEARFCGVRRTGRKPYCDAHQRAAWIRHRET